MTLCFEFNYASSNEILEYFLRFYAGKSGLKFSIERVTERLNLSVQGEQEQLLAFADELSARVPHSIFVRDSRVYVSERISEASSQGRVQNLLSNITPSMIDIFLAGRILPCENGILSDTSVWRNDRFEPVNEQNFSDLLNFTFEHIFSGEAVKFSDFAGEFELVKFDELDAKFSAVMPTNLKNLPKIFIASKEEQIALASYEKPAVTLKTTALYRQNHPDAPRFFAVLAARDLFIYALCERLFKSGVNFIAVNASKPLFSVTVLENDYIFSHAQNYYSKIVADAILQAQDADLESFKRIISSEPGGTWLRLFLSKFRADAIVIWHKNESVSMLNFSLPDSFEQLFELIAREQGGDRLLANYAANFILPSGSIGAPNSFFTLFCMIGVILGFDSDLQKAGTKLLENAMDFNGQKGPRIDFKMASKREFDVVRFFRSGMSFRLAGVDDRLLSYGYIESFAHFLSDFIDALKDEIDVKGVVLHGSLFECKTLANLVQKHVGAGLKVKFSHELSLEEF